MQHASDKDFIIPYIIIDHMLLHMNGAHACEQLIARFAGEW